MFILDYSVSVFYSAVKETNKTTRQMSCVSISDEREIWIAKQDVTLWKFRAKEKPMSMLYKKGTQFRVR